MEAQTHPSGISGTRRAMKEMADGTIRVQVDIDPAFRMAFLQMFPNIDMPVALAPLRADFEQQAPTPSTEQEKPKGGALAKLAGQFCNDTDFWSFLEDHHAVQYASLTPPGDVAAEFIRSKCGIQSRADLDHNREAAEIFNAEFRLPFLAWQGEQD